jgi:hypothetical protein
MPLRLTPSCEGTLPADRVRAYLPKICLEQYLKGVATTLFVFWNHNMHFVKVPPQVFDSNNPTLRPSWMWAGRYTDCAGLHQEALGSAQEAANLRGVLGKGDPSTE